MRSDHHLPSHRRSTGPETGWQFPPHQVSPHLNPQRQNFSRVHKVPSKHRTENDLVIAKKTSKSQHSIGGSPTPAHPRRQVHKAQICRSIIRIDLTHSSHSSTSGSQASQAAEVVLNLVPEWKFHRPVLPAQRVLSTVAPLQLAPICRPRSKWLRPAPPHTPRSTQKTLHLVVF